MPNKACAFHVAFNPDARCGKPARFFILCYGSPMWLCAKHYDDMAGYFRDEAQRGDSDGLTIVRENRL